MGVCDSGTRPVAGDAGCVRVGTTRVPAGFVAEEWGFKARLPAAACTGATIAVLGKDKCEPIDDCSKAFPPADTKILVRADGAPIAARPDLVVVKTLAEALETAAPLARIAVDEGEYALPPKFTHGVRITGRCAERTSLRGTDFGVNVDLAANLSFESVAFTGGTKSSFLIAHDAVVTLDRVYVRGASSGATVGNWASLTATRTVFEAPAKPPSATSVLTGIHATYDGNVTLKGVEIRGYQLSVAAQSVGSEVSISNSVIHDQQLHGAPKEALGHISSFLGAIVTVDESHIEAGPARIAMVGSARLDGQGDPTSKESPPGTLRVNNSTLVQSGVRREAASGVDTVEGGVLELDNVTLSHDSYAALGASGAPLTVRNSVILTKLSAVNARIGILATDRSDVVFESSAVIGSSMFAILLDKKSKAEIKGSLFSGNREVGIADYTMFMGAAQAVTVSRGGFARIHDSAFVENQGTAIFLAEGTAEVERTVLVSTKASGDRPLTAAITAVDATLLVRSSTFSKNDRAMALRNGRALLTESAVTDHREAIRLEGVALQETADAFEAADATCVVARTSFLRNAVRVSKKSLTDE